jgi:hypothetical protein
MLLSLLRTSNTLFQESCGVPSTTLSAHSYNQLSLIYSERIAPTKCTSRSEIFNYVLGAGLQRECYYPKTFVTIRTRTYSILERSPGGLLACLKSDFWCGEFFFTFWTDSHDVYIDWRVKYLILSSKERAHQTCTIEI